MEMGAPDVSILDLNPQELQAIATLISWHTSCSLSFMKEIEYMDDHEKGEAVPIKITDPAPIHANIQAGASIESSLLWRLSGYLYHHCTGIQERLRKHSRAQVHNTLSCVNCGPDLSLEPFPHPQIHREWYGNIPTEGLVPKVLPPFDIIPVLHNDSKTFHPRIPMMFCNEKGEVIKFAYVPPQQAKPKPWELTRSVAEVNNQAFRDAQKAHSIYISQQ